MIKNHHIKLISFWGILLLFVATTWQIFFTDTLNTDLVRWHARLNFEAIHAVLDYMDDLTYLHREEPNSESLNRVSQKFIDAQIESYQSKKKMDKWRDEGQIVPITKINRVLFMIGSALILTSKFLEYKKSKSEPVE